MASSIGAFVAGTGPDIGSYQNAQAGGLAAALETITIAGQAATILKAKTFDAALETIAITTNPAAVFMELVVSAILETLTIGMLRFGEGARRNFRLGMIMNRIRNMGRLR
jgi:hypothetical protein